MKYRINKIGLFAKREKRHQIEKNECDSYDKGSL